MHKIIFGAVLVALIGVMLLFFTAADTDHAAVFQEKNLIDRPNQFLVCPPSFCADEAHMGAPVFEVSAERLAVAWDQQFGKLDRVELFQASSPSRREYVVRSKLFRFPDRISVEFVPLGENSSSLAILSRSKYGYSDAGVNEKRVTKLLGQLARDLQK